jgi:hypothetical protein
MEERRRKEEDEEDVNLSLYYDAQQTSKSPPLGSSRKKKQIKEKKKVRKAESTGSSESDSFFSSVSKHSISSSCSPEQLKKNAEKRIIKLSKELREEDLSEEHLKTMKYDASAMSKKIDLHGDADDEDLNFLVEKLENLITRIDKKKWKIRRYLKGRRDSFLAVNS